jgi:hypothetical protein
MTELIELGIIVFALPFIVQLILFVFILAITIHHSLSILNLVHNRKKNTVSKTMLFVESMLRDKSVDIGLEVSNIYYDINDNRILTSSQEVELASFNSALQLAFFVGLRHNIKEYLRENGYWNLYKLKSEKEETRNKLEQLYDLRGKQLRLAVIPYIEGVLSKQSELRGTYMNIFTKETFIEMFRTIVSYHCGCIKDEENDINSYISKLFPFVPTKIIPKYRHKSI